jgi:hypothetical protein
MNEELFKALGLNVESAKEKAFTQGLLGSIFQAAALSGPQARPVGNLQGLGQIGLAGMGAYESSFDKTLQDAIKGLQVKDLLAKRADEESMRQAQRTFQSRLAGATTMQPPGIVAGAEQQAALMNQMRFPGEQGVPTEDVEMTRQALTSNLPRRAVTDEVAANQAVLDYLRVASPVEYAKLVAKEPRALPSSVQEYQFAVSQGFKGTFADYQEQMNKSRATNINLPSEGERKAGFLANRVQFGLQQMADVIKTNAPAASPEKLPSLVKFLTQSDFLSNSLTSPDRQRIEAAQLDILDAALTLGTGAAYTREQLEGYRKAYFPQLNDDKTTIADKQRRLENLLESAYITAGRSAPTAGQRPSFSGQAAPSAPAAPSGAPKGSLRSILFPDRK